MMAVDHLRSFSFALLRLCTTGSTVSCALLCDSSRCKGFVVVVAVLFLYLDARGILVTARKKKDWQLIISGVFPGQRSLLVAILDHHLQTQAMQTFHLTCSFPTDPVHVFFFTQVVNATELRSRLLAGDQNYLYAFVDGDLVPAPLDSRTNLISDFEPDAAAGSCQQSGT
jgi:hypothetical protein